VKCYCLGFIFSPDQSQVALLKKRSSDSYNPDCWNGVGGKVEVEETSVQAMARETWEETAMHISEEQWKRIGCLSDGKTFEVNVFAAVSDQYPRTTTDENVMMFNRHSAQQKILAHGVEEILLAWFNGEHLI